MGSYIQNTLIKNEEVFYEAKVSVWSMLPLILLGIITLPFLVGFLFLLAAIIRYTTTELAITNKRVIAKFGLIRRSTVELNLSKVEAVLVEQGIIGRIFNFGSVVVSGTGEAKAPIPGISNPLTFRKKFFEAQDIQ